MEVEVFIDMVLVRVGRVGITMTFQGLMEPFPEEGAEDLTQVVVDRLNVEL